MLLNCQGLSPNTPPNKQSNSPPTSDNPSPKALNIGAKKKTAPLHLLRVCEANHLAGQAGDNLKALKEARKGIP